jgi:hypothetical protein
MSRYVIRPRVVARSAVVPRHDARGFVTSHTAPTGVVTFHILAETGDVLATEAGDQLRTE